MLTLEQTVRTAKFTARFNSKINKNTPSGCWLWVGATVHPPISKKRKSELRPYVSVPKNEDCASRQHYAHRISWIIKNGPIPKGMMVCHHCDNTLCVNPDHLFVGTHRDNMLDMVSKGRQGNHKGELHGMAKLTEAEVRFILSSNATGVSLAKKFRVHESTICLIRKKKHWTHVSL